MTVSSNDPRKTYSGNGVTTDFATPYFLVDADIKVYLGGVLQTITTHYTLTGAGVAAGGTAAFLTPPPTGTGNVVIINDPALTQELDLVENDRNPAEAREDALDKLTIIAQRLADRVSRVVQLSETDTATTLTVPALADRLSKFLAFDASGNLIAADGGTMGVPVSAFMATVLDDADAAAAFTTLGISAFVQTLLDDTDAGAFRASLGVGVTSPTITATDADLTITAAQFAAYDTLVLDLSAWTIPRNVIVPAVGRNFNAAITGSYTATVKTSAGTGIPVAAGTSRPLVCDGANVVDPLTAFPTQAAPFVPHGYISGMVCTNNATDANNDIDISAGVCRDSTNTVTINGSAMTKRLDAAWAAGTGNGGLDTGSKAVSTEYYLHAILKDSDASVDYLFSASRTAPTMPSGYTYFRNIGWCKTDGSGSIVGIIVRELSGGGVSIAKKTITNDLDVATTSYTTPANVAVDVMSGVKVKADLTYFLSDSNACYVFIYDPDLSDVAPERTVPSTNVSNINAGTGAALSVTNVWTNTSKQIRIASSETLTALRLAVIQFEWSRR